MSTKDVSLSPGSRAVKDEMGYAHGTRVPPLSSTVE